MKLIIDIDEEIYKRICEAQSVPDMYGTDIVNALNSIIGGVPYNAPTVAINKDFYRKDKSNPINRSDLFQ